MVVPVVPASPVDLTFHPAEVNAALPFAASPVVVVPFRTTTDVEPWSAGVPAAGACDAGADAEDEADEDGAALDDAEADAEEDAAGESEPGKE